MDAQGVPNDCRMEAEDDGTEDDGEQNEGGCEEKNEGGEQGALEMHVQEEEVAQEEEEGEPAAAAGPSEDEAGPLSASTPDDEWDLSGEPAQGDGWPHATAPPQIPQVPCLAPHAMPASAPLPNLGTGDSDAMHDDSLPPSS